MNLFEQQRARVAENLRRAYGHNELAKAVEGEDLLKGKKANIGEIREWNGKKVQKQANGEWHPINPPSKIYESETPSGYTKFYDLPDGKKLKDLVPVGSKILFSPTNDAWNYSEGVVSEIKEGTSLSGKKYDYFIISQGNQKFQRGLHQIKFKPKIKEKDLIDKKEQKPVSVYEVLRSHRPIKVNIKDFENELKKEGFFKHTDKSSPISQEGYVEYQKGDNFLISINLKEGTAVNTSEMLFDI